MRITAITVQQRDANRVNVMVDGKYRFSLDITQVVDLGIKIGNEYDNDELRKLEDESQFGKLYARTLEYCLMRPHSSKEVRDYLYKKTLTKKVRNKRTGEIIDREGVSETITKRVYERLLEKDYINDEKFAKFWVENRNQRKGSSMRKLRNELMIKGVNAKFIDNALAESERDDIGELKKIIAKKANKYDEQKLIQYLARQGFSYDDIKSAISSD